MPGEEFRRRASAWCYSQNIYLVHNNLWFGGFLNQTWWFCINSPQWIHLSLSCLVTSESMLILIIYSILWWGVHTFSILSSMLLIKILVIGILRRYFKSWWTRVDLWPWDEQRCDSLSEHQINVLQALNGEKKVKKKKKSEKKIKQEHNSNICLYTVKVFESGFSCKPFVMHNWIY